MESAIERLNSEFPGRGFNIENILKYKEKLDSKRYEIEKKFPIDNSKLPPFVLEVIDKVERNKKHVEELTEELEDLEEAVLKHEAKVENVQKDCQEVMDQISLLDNAQAYLRILQRIETISQSMESDLNERGRKVVIEFTELCSMAKSLSDTHCKHLLHYLGETLHYWHAILKEKFSKEFDDILKSLKWPFLGTNVTPTPSVDLLAKFQSLVETLINIQVPERLTSAEESLPPDPAINVPALSLPVALLVRPLKKRFVFHFSGNRQTNQADKPEWYFTQILTWVRDHQEFVEKHAQPVYNRLQMGHISAKVELTRGLVQLAMEKLHWDLPQLAYDDLLFSHTVDEALGFDRELRDGYGYTDKQASVLAVLTKAQNFVKWINLEKKYSLEKLDNIMRSSSAFRPNNPVDEGEITTECADGFLTLLSTLTDRYTSLPEPGHKLQFFQLQLDLLDDFRVRLLQLLRVEESCDLLTSSAPCILNTIRSLINVLEEWSITPHFLHLSYFKSRTENLEGKTDNSDAGESSVFSEILALFKRMEDNLMDKLTDDIIIEIKARSRAYRKDKWHAMESFDSLTPSSIPMFQKLTEQLRILHEVLTPSLQSAAILHFVREMDLFLFEEIVEESYFSPIGARQFAFDVQRNLIPLFGQYLNKPKVHFRLLMDSCALLTLPQGTALLLRSRLADPKDDDLPTAEVLADIKVYTLKTQQVKNILQRRTDLAAIK